MRFLEQSERSKGFHSNIKVERHCITVLVVTLRWLWPTLGAQNVGGDSSVGEKVRGAGARTGSPRTVAQRVSAGASVDTMITLFLSFLRFFLAAAASFICGFTFQGLPVTGTRHRLLSGVSTNCRPTLSQSMKVWVSSQEHRSESVECRLFLLAPQWPCGSMEMIQQRPALLSRKVKARLSDCGVSH